MPDRTETVWKGKNGIYFRAEWGEAIVSQNDTVTLDSFSATTNLLNAVIWQQDDGTEITNTHAANNVITVTGVATNVPCVYMAYGVKA